MRSNHCLRLISVAAIAAAIAACSGGSGDTANQTTTLSISLMDAAVDDVSEVNVQITAIWLKPAGDGPAFQLQLTQPSMTVDLLAHPSDDAASLVVDAVIAPGSYEWLAMDVNAEFDNVFDSYVKTTVGGMEEIEVPSGRVRLVSGFEVGDNPWGTEFLFDWDLRKALVDAPGQPGFFLHPAFRMIDVTEVTASGETVEYNIHGTIWSAAVSDVNDCNADAPEGHDRAGDYTYGNAVYIYAGLGVQPDDYDGTDDPVAAVTVPAVLNEAGDYEYGTTMVPGDYTVTFTCQAGNDDSETNETDNGVTADTVAFFSGVDATIIDVNSDVVVNFP